MKAYYNDNDKHAVAWLKELISAGLIMDGDVDDRSIADVTKADLEGYTQVHMFAGIGGWQYALELASWPATRHVWTGSCPCQPLSVAGLGQGELDERHLWPHFGRLIRECNPPVVFGEQVASKDGREWLAGVRADLEAMGYAVGAADLCAACVSSPHIRQRLYWLADSSGRRCEQCDEGQWSVQQSDEDGSTGRLADLQQSGLEGHAGDGASRHQSRRNNEKEAGSVAEGCCNFWSDFDLIPCGDGKARRIKPGTFPLAHGVSGRVGLLRGYGNAIVPEVAAEFIEAFMETK